MKDKDEHKTDSEMRVTIAKGYVTLNLCMPYKWLMLGIAVILMWRLPELWKAIEAVLPLFNS